MNRVLIAACGLVIAYMLVQIRTFGYGRDQGIYAMVASTFTRGGMPYRDAWDFKPPGVFLVYAISRAVFGSGQSGIRFLEVIGLLGMVAAMIRLTDIWWSDRRIGLMAGTIAVVVHAQLDFWHTAQPESFGGMTTIFALVVLGRHAFSVDEGTKRERLSRWLGAGVLFGISGLLKPPLAGGGAVVAMFLAAGCLREAGPFGGRLRRAAVPALAILAGGALPFALCLAWFGAKGALHDLVQVLFVFTPHYTALSWVGESVTGMAYWGFTEWLCTYSSLPTAGILLLLALQPTREERPGVALLACIIGVHVAGIAMQGKFFPYHFGATWPPTSLLAALGFMRVWARVERRGPVAVVAFFAFVWVCSLFRTATKDTPDSFRERCDKRVSLVLGGLHDQAALDKLASVADVNASANRAVAELLRARVPEGRPIFVWGFEPVIYDLADRAPSTRYLYDVPQRVEWAKDDARGVMMRDLETRPPAAIVVEHRDVFPMVTGTTIDSADTLREFWALADLLHRRYVLTESIEDFDIYLEQPRAAPVE